MPGVTPEIHNEILDESSLSAKNRIVSRTPQLEDILTEVKQWFGDSKEKKSK